MTASGPRACVCVRARALVAPCVVPAAWQLLLAGAYFTMDMDTSVFTQSPAVGLTSSRNTNATAITQAWRLLVAAGVGGEVDATVGPYRQVCASPWVPANGVPGVPGVRGWVGGAGWGRGERPCTCMCVRVCA